MVKTFLNAWRPGQKLWLARLFGAAVRQESEVEKTVNLTARAGAHSPGVGFAGATTMQPAGASPTESESGPPHIEHAPAASAPFTLTFYWSGIILHLECLLKRKRVGSNCCKARSIY